MNAKKEYDKFIEKYPNYIDLIDSYEQYDKYSLKFWLHDGRTALYFPLNIEEPKKKKR